MTDKEIDLLKWSAFVVLGWGAAVLDEAGSVSGPYSALAGPDREYGTGNPPRQRQALLGNSRIIHRAELVLEKESPKKKFVLAIYFVFVCTLFLKLRDRVGVTPKKVASPGAINLRNCPECNG
ncbi:hypothetical protein J6590_042953 [Homalodisca vitripennis]|nr:hypothetical protein J6590_042953 [Homalodisca vitripennis]